MREYGTIKAVQVIECLGYRLDKSKREAREVKRDLIKEGLSPKLQSETYIRKQ